MSQSYHLLTVPRGSTVELSDDGSVLAFLPDGSAQRAYFRFDERGITPIVENYPPIRLNFGRK